MTTGNDFDQINIAETIYPYQGTGDMHIHQQPVTDYFGNGLKAMRHLLYKQAVECFEKYLSTARPSGDQENGGSEKLARAHFYSAMAMLGRHQPRSMSFDDINCINERLEQARKLGNGYPVYHQASVLWAIVKEGYYVADGQAMPEPPITELLASVHCLSADDLEVFVAHMARVATKSWRSLAERALELGVELEVPGEDTPRKLDRKRPEAVPKYFLKTPERVTVTRAIMALGAGLAAIMVGLFLGGNMVVILLFAGGFLLFLSAVRYVDYQAYLRAYERAEPKPSHDQMDRWLQEDLVVLTRGAARRLRLNPALLHESGDLVIRPLIVVGIPDDKDYLGRAGRVQLRKGDDGKLRADFYDVYILFLTRGLVSTYRCVLNFASGKLIFDEAHEYHYRDIVGVHSWSIPIPSNLLEVLKSEHGIGTDPDLVELAALSITSGDRFNINIGIASHGHREVAEVAWRNKHTLNILQKMIRDHH